MKNMSLISISMFALLVSLYSNAESTLNNLKISDPTKLNNLKILATANKTLKNNTPALKPFKQIGVTREIDNNERSIMIQGLKYYYGINTKVKTTGSNFLPITSIKNGTRVGINYTTDKNGKRLLYEIEIIPRNVKLRSASEYE